MGTPSDCTAPSTSHNRGPSTAYRCRRKIAFRRCLVVIFGQSGPSATSFALGRTVARWSRDKARNHQKYHQSGPARPATGGAQNGGDFVVVKRKMARTGRRALGSARRSQANSSPARCVRALRLNSMPRLHSLRREASSTPRRTLFGAHGFGGALRRLSSQSMVAPQRFPGVPERSSGEWARLLLS